VLVTVAAADFLRSMSCTLVTVPLSMQGVLHAGGSGPRVFAAAGLAGCTTNALLYPLEVCALQLHVFSRLCLNPPIRL
jgi:hypothetical protein